MKVQFVNLDTGEIFQKEYKMVNYFASEKAFRELILSKVLRKKVIASMLGETKKTTIEIEFLDE